MNGIGRKLVALGLLGLAQRAAAVPSYARQTGWDCAQCHTVYPELTPVGRRFKLDGYSTDAESKDAGAPISALMQLGDTFLRSQPAASAPADASDHSGRVRMPEHVSLFLAGPVVSHLGTFTEFAYDPDEGKIGLDMLDVRYARSLTVGGKDLTLGLVATNQPTMQDPWNTGPAWGFPFVTSPDVPSPAAKVGLGGMGGVGSLGAYGSFNDLLYVEASAYRSAHQGEASPMDTFIQGYSPYWRVALSHDMGSVSAELGAYGLFSRVYPSVSAPAMLAFPGPKDRTNDVAGDFQLQVLGDVHLVTIRGIVVQESAFPEASQGAGMSANGENNLLKSNMSASYAFNRTVVGSIGYLLVTGTPDAMRYPAAVGGSPKSAAVTYGVDYLPWPAAKLSAQCTVFARLDGASRVAGDARNADAVALMGQLVF